MKQMRSKAVYPLDVFQSIINSSTTNKSEDLSVGELFPVISQFPAPLLKSLHWVRIKAGNIIYEACVKTHSFPPPFHIKRFPQANKITEGQNGSRKYQFFSSNCDDTALAWRIMLAVVKGPSGFPGTRLLAQGDFECFQSFCLVQGFVCCSLHCLWNIVWL